jgi:spore coat protein A
MISRRQFFRLSAATGVGLTVGSRMGIWNARPAFAQVGQQPPLPGNQIPQFIDPLPDLTNNGLHVITSTEITLSMEEFQSPVMPSTFMPGVYTGTYVWGYKEAGQTATAYINPVVIAQRGIPTKMTFVNNLGGTGGSQVTAWVTSTDQTLHWANPNNLPMEDPPGTPNPARLLNYSGSIPAVVHLHGGEVPPWIDGGPDAWYTSDGDHHGAAYYAGLGGGDNSAAFRYPNSQEGANIWFHDHALGITRLNVYAGMAGAYIINEPGLWAPGSGAPKPDLIPLVIQDRKFDINGQLFFDNIGLNPQHPFWVPEFVGDTIVVNGKVWPFKDVDRKRYTLLFLNGSNARFYDMFFIDPVSGVKGPPMYVISTDGGYLSNPVLIDPNATGQKKKAGVAKSLIVGPGERYEAIVDFNDATWLANIAAGYAALGLPVPPTISLHLRNQARTPFPGGAPAPNSTTGRIMEFRVSGNTPADSSFNPAGLAALRSRPIIRLVDPAAGAPAPGVTPAVKRQLTLNEVMGPGGPLEVLVNNTKWNGVRHDGTPIPGSQPDGIGNYLTEWPKEGDIEQWEIINLTADAHPIHLHLVQFQLMNRQQFDSAGYTGAYNAAFPGIAGDPVGGMFIPAFGPPYDYDNTNNPDFATQTDPPTVGGNPAVGPFLNPKKWPAVPPLQSEAGWKDTVIMYPGEVTRILVRWAPTDVALGDTANEHYPFDPSGADYVWHCHIIDHEDNEMMRPDQVEPKSGVTRTYTKGTDY